MRLGGIHGDDAMPEKDQNPDEAGKTAAAMPVVPAPQDESAFGYGHRAHSPDPNASYGFDPGEPRTLPHDRKKRWKVPG
jgi:hypothetical protein